MDDKTPKDVTQYQKHYSEKGLLEKIGATFKKAGLKVIYYVLLLYYVLNDENTPMQHKMIIIGALGYLILPVDLIPDFIPVAGFTDDAAALLLVSRLSAKMSHQRLKQRLLISSVTGSVRLNVRRSRNMMTITQHKSLIC